MMTHHDWKFGGLVLALLVGAGCDPGQTPRSGDGRDCSAVECDIPSDDPERGDVCGETTVALIAGQHIDVGSVTVTTDESTICVAFTTSDDWYLTETHVAIATDPGDLPQVQGNPAPGQFPYAHEDLWTQFDEFCVPLADVGAVLGDPLYIASHAAVAQVIDDDIVAAETAWGAGQEFPGASWGTYFEVIPELCDEPGCGFRTQTQGGWGSTCAGDNPGCYRDANFAAAFPEGLTVGCEVLVATLATSAAVEQALPTGGQPRAMLASEAGLYTGSADDPKVGTVLFGQVVALGLSLGFDANEPVALAELVVVDPDSPCVGLSVAEVFAQANAALGGCPADLSAAALNDCAAAINEAFVDGDTDAAMCHDVLAPPDASRDGAR